MHSSNLYASYAPVFDKIWNSIAEKKAIGSTSRDPPKTLQDCSWTIGTLCQDLEEGFRLRKSLVQSKSNAAVTQEEEPYISYGKVSPMNNHPNSKKAEQLLNSLYKEKYRGVFANTRIETNMKNVIRDYALEKKTGTLFSIKSFQFKSFNFQLKKGTEVKEVYREYCKMGVVTAEEFYARAIRDFYNAVFMLQFIKGFDPNILSICSSIHCLTSCIDYVGAPDGCKSGGRKAYEAAITDGLTLCGGDCYAKSVNDVILVASYMKYKDDTLYSYCKNLDELQPQRDGYSVPSPFEYLETRWWDGTGPSYFTMPFVFSNKSAIPVDDDGVPVGARHCPAIRAGVDATFRYNDIIDVIHDVEFGEPFNEVHIASRYGGFAAIFGYADAVAATVENVANCDCSVGDKIHDWATDQANGAACFYVLVPRYRAFTQLAETRKLTSSIFEELMKTSNHGAFLTTRIAKIDDSKNRGVLHDENWMPIYTVVTIQRHVEGQDCQHCEEICKWVVGRCIYRKARATYKNTIKQFIRSSVHENSCPDMTTFFGDLIRILGNSQFSENIVEACADSVDTIWKTLTWAGSDSCHLADLAAKIVENHILINKVILKTHQVPRAHPLRRVTLGAISLMMDRTHLGIYPRILDAAIINAGGPNTTRVSAG